MSCSFDPTKHGLKQTRIGPTMLNFQPELEQASSHHLFPKGMGRGNNLSHSQAL